MLCAVGHAQVVGTPVTGGQAPPPVLSATAVLRLPQLAAINRSSRVSEVNVVWSGGLSAGVTSVGNTASQLAVLGARSIDSGMQRERDPQLAEDEIVAVAVDAAGQPLGWHHLKDPRTLRAEAPGADGILSGQTLRRAVAEFVMPLPEGVGIRAVRVYEVGWNGQAFVLVPVGDVSVNVP